MPSRNSNAETDGVVWNTVSLRLGSQGMDLRRPSEPPALADLLNARFLDEQTIQRRDGYSGQELRDGDVFPAGTLNPATWVYGHGMKVGTFGGVAPTQENIHYPIHLRGQATFRLGSADVAWTGDRLLIPQANGNAAIGSSSFWQRVPDLVAGDAATKQYPRGIPAHLPLETESSAPAGVRGTYVESCLTPTLQVYANVLNNAVTVTTINRSTGAIVDTTDITSGAVTPVQPTVFSSAGTPFVAFLDSTKNVLHIRYWTGTAWTLDEQLTDAVAAYDVAPNATGFLLLWRTGSSIKIGQYVGTTSVSNTYAFGTILGTHENPAGPIATACTPSGGFGLAYMVSGATDLVAFEEFTSAAAYSGFRVPSSTTGMALSGASTLRGLSVTSRQLRNSDGNYPWAVHFGDLNGHVTIASFSATNSITNGGAGGGRDGIATHVRFQSDLISRSFTVGDEVFAWLRSRNSSSIYQLAGSIHPYVSATADHEVGLVPTGSWPQRVWPDPNDATGMTRTWTRTFNTNDAAREGNVLVGTLSYLPQLSVAAFGKSLYLSGSCVKNWDGQTLADAGFIDYPKVATITQQAGGGLVALGIYEWLARAVRYNLEGERFESLALTSTQTTLTTGNQSVQLTIAVPPGVSTPDTVIEIYRTTNLGQAFFLEGTVDAPYTSETVSFTSTMPDATLIKQEADPHETGVGATSVTESAAPLGCAILATVGDRLWGAGGQVGAGIAQFSLLKSAGFGAGFDAEAGYIQVDNEGGGVTSIAGQDGAVVVFELNKIYVFSDGGPDNFGVGSYEAPQIVLAAGAVNHNGTALTQLGTLYWGAEGPLLLERGIHIINISSPVRPLTETLTPVGVQVDPARMEVVWHCGNQAVLWNYMGNNSRWARWQVPAVAGCSQYAAMTSAGRQLAENALAPGDDSVPYAFMFRTGNLRADKLLQGHTRIRRVGILGQHDGPHTVRLRTYYDGSPCWSSEATWQPETNTWLTAASSISSLTPLAVDAQNYLDRSGKYSTNRRVDRNDCDYFSLEITDIASATPTFTPFELSFELGAMPGMGRTPVATYK